MISASALFAFFTGCALLFHNLGQPNEKQSRDALDKTFQYISVICCVTAAYALAKVIEGA